MFKEASGDKLEGMRRGLARHFTEPVVAVIARTGATPDLLTWCGFLITLGAAFLAGLGLLVWAGLTSLFAALFDTLDGALARRLHRVTVFGGVLDSTLDRLSEGAVLVGILLWYINTDGPYLRYEALLVGAALITSYAVSYIRARAEGAGIKCEVGISTRPERVILTSLGLISGQVTLALAVIALTGTVTVIQRLSRVRRASRNKE